MIHISRQFGLAVLMLSSIHLGCAAPRVETGSEKVMKASLTRVRESLPEGRRDEFDKALQVLMFSSLDVEGAMAAAMAGKKVTQEDVSKGMYAALEGKSADEIIEAANRVTAEREAKAREAAVKEIAALINEREKARQAGAELAKFEILRAKYAKEKDYFGMSQPSILLTVKNGTSHAVSHAYFTGILSSPGRSVPWLKEDFNHQIRGGLEPGETATWNLRPNSFSAWGSVDAPLDAGLTVTVVRIDGANGEPLFSTTDFSEADAARLDALQKQYGK